MPITIEPSHQFETTTYNQPGLSFDGVPGLAVAGGTSSPLFIPMRLTSFSAPSAKPKINVNPIIPLQDPATNLAYGGNLISEGVLESRKILMEGTIDTPMTQFGTTYLSNVTVGSFRVSYAEVIAMAIEGRLTIKGWSRVDPRWFRDPYGRVYGDYNSDDSVTRPKILDFKASFTEAAPTRTQFSMTLKV